MLKHAFKRINKDDKIILHSNQGWQYTYPLYMTILKENNIIQSMSRKGNCLDNVIIENFFRAIKSELFYINNYRIIND